MFLNSRVTDCLFHKGTQSRSSTAVHKEANDNLANIMGLLTLFLA